MQVCFQEVVSPGDEEPPSHLPHRPLLLLLPLLPGHIHRCQRNPRPPQVTCTHLSSLFFTRVPSIFSILNVFLLNDGIRRNIPKLGYPTLLDIWICGCFLATFLIRYVSAIRKFKSCKVIFSPQFPVRPGAELLHDWQGGDCTGD